MHIARQPSQKMFRFFLLLVTVCFVPAHAQPHTQESPSNTPAHEKSSDKKPAAAAQGGVEILSDTNGIDFRLYLSRFRFDVQNNWYPLVPLAAQPPAKKFGITVIEFAIMKDGKVSGMKKVESSGDSELDQAAWDGVKAGTPYEPLPLGFKGDSLRLRCSFVYNPVAKKEITAPVKTSAERASQPPASASAEISSAVKKTDEPKNPDPITTRGMIAVLSDHKGLDTEIYSKLILQKIQTSLQPLLHNIPPSSGKKPGQVIFDFTILRSGEVKDIKLKKSSGDRPFDNAVWEALQSASPLQELPESFKSKALKIRWQMDVP